NFIVFVLPFKFNYKIILSLSLFIPLFSEIINSAIERVVDLYTAEYNELAKKAKDIGAFLVFLSFVVTIIIWIVIISINLNS
ncbi:MAG: diacylglycerol kinase, partial [Flavobacteriales bacterium]